MKLKTSTMQPLNLVEKLISSHIYMGMWLPIDAAIKVDPYE